MAEAKTITPKELSEKLGSDSKTVRRFLRATRPDAKPGQGGRWEIPAADVAKLKTAYAKWTKAQEEAKAKREADKAAKAQQAPAADETEPTAERQADVVDQAIANGGLPKAEQAKSEHKARSRKPRAGAKTTAE
jgi:hypothetical protein